MKTATRFLTLMVLGLGLAIGAQAQIQEVTIREAQNVPQANLDALQALGADATATDVTNQIVYDFDGQSVQIVGVVLTDPFSSGNASWDDGANQPNRIHVFVRDTSVVTQGYEGMTTQLVDASGLVLQMQVGNVYLIQGVVDPFLTTFQIAPDAIEDLGPYQGLGLPDEIMDPISASTDDLAQVVGTTGGGGPLLQANWANFNDYNNQYVSFDNVLVTVSQADPDGRPNYQWSSSGTDAAVNSDDISLRFRNDRGGDSDYPNPPYDTRPSNDPFDPPATGAVINIQGFASFGAFDFNSDTQPSGAIFGVSPWVDSDLVVVESPPVFGAVQGITEVPGNEPVTISVEVTPDPSRTVDSVVLDYSSPNARSAGFGGSVAMTDDGSGTYSADIPAAPDGAFVVYTIIATDNVGAMSVSDEQVYRVLYDGITAIAQIQETVDGLPGPTPFDGITASNIDLTATVQADFFTGGGDDRYLILQDDPTLEGWTGIWARVDAADVVAVGDEITITESEIEESFGLTRLDAPVFTVGAAGTPLGHKVVPTGVLNGDDPGLQEAHEGMLLRFEDVTITDANADGPDDGSGSNFGEWQFSSDGTEDNEVRADDFSDAFTSSYNLDNFEVGQGREFIQGAWYYSFGNYKLVPVEEGDIGAIVVANEPVAPAVPGSYQLFDAYPNPFRATATIRYEVGDAGPVTLKVYDVLGREVATLVDAQLAPSTYEVTLDARGLAAGAYVYRLNAGDTMLTGQLTLVK